MIGRCVALAAAVAALALSLTTVVSAAEPTKITVGNVPGGNTIFLPSYVAMDRGFFKKEGLDAK